MPKGQGGVRGRGYQDARAFSLVQIRIAGYKSNCRSFHCGSAVTNPTTIREDVGSISGLDRWVKNLVLS